jgi:hypothetical protein
MKMEWFERPVSGKDMPGINNILNFKYQIKSARFILHPAHITT